MRALLLGLLLSCLAIWGFSVLFPNFAGLFIWLAVVAGLGVFQRIDDCEMLKHGRGLPAGMLMALAIFCLFGGVVVGVLILGTQWMVFLTGFGSLLLLLASSAFCEIMQGADRIWGIQTTSG